MVAMAAAVDLVAPAEPAEMAEPADKERVAIASQVASATEATVVHLGPVVKAETEAWVARAVMAARGVR